MDAGVARARADNKWKGEVMTFRLGRRLSPPIVVALLALFAAPSAGSHTVVRPQMGGPQSADVHTDYLGTASKLRVHTRAGWIRGAREGSVRAWKGVPYAAPPVGNLRWRPPAPVRRWSGARDATQTAPPCIQLTFDASGNPNGGTTGSEDCLYLNVFAPATTTPGSRLAVMVHLHPGGNTLGWTYTNASGLVARNVVVVTVGYRLGVFGFVGHPLLTAEGGGSSGEYGMLDQLAALRWVRDNIAAFGGDPRRVTLFGSSAGSFDTVALMASPLARRLIARASVQAEVFWGLTGRSNTIADAERIGIDASTRVGCEAAQDVLACLRMTPAAALVVAAGNFGTFPWVGGRVLPKPPIELLADRRSLPLLVGFDREEDSSFALPGLPDPYSEANWVQDTNALVGPERGAQARELYPGSAYDSLKWSYITMLTDAVRGCPTRRLADEARGPAWRWLNTHTYENDPFLAQFRAGHIFEEPLIWHDFSILFGRPYTPTPSEEALSQTMTRYWTNFGKTGNPNGPGLARWPRYDGNPSEPLLALDDRPDVVRSYHVAQCTFLDTIPEPFPP
jgi:para-nitrobenzyl esterase